MSRQQSVTHPVLEQIQQRLEGWVLVRLFLPETVDLATPSTRASTKGRQGAPHLAGMLRPREAMDWSGALASPSLPPVACFFIGKK